MLSEQMRLAKHKTLERDADAALRALSAEEKTVLRQAWTGEIIDVPEERQQHLLELQLGVYRPAGFGLTELGRTAAEKLLAEAEGPSPPSE